MEQIKILKVDAALRQLETSIRMFSEDREPVSTHTLVAAAHEILTDLAKRQDKAVVSILKANPHIRQAKQKEFREMVVEAENFFKHADRDPDKIFIFNPETTVYFLIDAIEIFQQLGHKISPMMAAMYAWFLLEHPDVFVDSPQYQALSAVCTRANLNPANKSRFFQIFEQLSF